MGSPTNPSHPQIRLAPSGERILLGRGLVLVLDDRFVDDVPGWCLRDRDERVGRVTVGQAARLCEGRLLRPIVALTTALVCELHARALAPAGSELVSPATITAVKHRLVSELAEALSELAPAAA